MKGTGTLAMHKAMENSQTKLVKHMRENGLIICAMAKAFLFTQMEANMKVNGSRMLSVESVLRFGKTKISKELTQMEKRMALDGTSGKIMHSTRVTGLRAKSMGLVPIDGQMEESSQVSGSTAR